MTETEEEQAILAAFRRWQGVVREIAASPLLGDCTDAYQIREGRRREEATAFAALVRLRDAEETGE